MLFHTWLLFSLDFRPTASSGKIGTSQPTVGDWKKMTFPVPRRVFNK